MAKQDENKSKLNIAEKDTLIKNVFRSVKFMVTNAEQTDFHADFLRMYEEAKEFGKATKSMIERIKTVVQPNPLWQRDTIPPTDEFTPFDLFVNELTEAAKHLKPKYPKVSAFYEKEAAAVGESGKAYSHFLVSVKANTLRPLEKYVNEDLEQIKTEYFKLERYKKIYDDGRLKLKECKQEKIEKAASDLGTIKDEFEKQAQLVTVLLQRLPEHKDTQKKAIRQMSLAMRLYHEKSAEVGMKMLQETRDASAH